MSFKEKKTKHITPNRNSFYDQFNDSGTRITDDHLPTAVNQDFKILFTALWGAWEMSNDAAKDLLGELVSHSQDFEGKLGKLTEFAELAGYATGFDIPEDRTFRYIDLDALAEGED